MGGRTILRQARESCEGGVAPRFDEREVAYQGNAFELALAVATPIEGASIELTRQPVVADEPGDENSVDRAGRKEC